MYNEDEYLLISGIQHFVFCRRQWALIHIEQQWCENYRTADGRIMHRNVHDKDFNEKRNDLVIVRGMAVSSAELGVSGECDVVEFRRSQDGTEIFGRDGKYTVTPIEYKRGEPKENDSDIMQLAAQAMCLEFMLCCDIPFGYLFYGETRRRTKVEFNEEIRQKTKATIEEMHKQFHIGKTPVVKRSKNCNACSLKDICLPSLPSVKTVSEYLSDMLEA